MTNPELIKLEELFQKVRNESNIDNLNEYKFNLSMVIGESHELLHSGNVDRSKTLSIINSMNTLIEIINDKIYDVRKQNNQKKSEQFKEQKAEQKQYNIELSNLGLAAKKLLPSKTYKALILTAKTLSHADISKLKERDLAILEA